MSRLWSLARSFRGIEVMLALVEAGIVVALAAVAFEPASASAWPVASGLAAILGIIVLFAWRYPLLALGAAIVALIGYHLAEFTPVGMTWPLVIPYVVVAARGYLRIGVVAAIILSMNSISWRTWVEQESFRWIWLEEALALAVVALALAVGTAIYQRHLWADEVRERLRQVEVAANREKERLVAESRLAAAADLHDIAGHSLVAIGLHLHIASEALEDDPVATREALAAALRAHDRALAETSETVRLLREGTQPPMAVEGTPMLDLAGLREIARAAGLNLQVRIDLASPVAPNVAVTAYRILQEALTNTIRHSGARHATLSIAGVDGGLRLTFMDDGPGQGLATGEGYGLKGMVERASQLGGTLEAGPAPIRGFRVEAWLPAQGATT